MSTLGEHSDSGVVEEQAQIEDLTAFQRDAIVAIAELEETNTPLRGMRVIEHLEKQGYGDVTHGRMYPALDDLVTGGVVRKESFDRRSNEYRLTDHGWSLLRERAERLADTVDGSVGGADE